MDGSDQLLFLDTVVPTADVVTAGNNDVSLVEARTVHFA